MALEVSTICEYCGGDCSIEPSAQPNTPTGKICHSIVSNQISHKVNAF